MIKTIELYTEQGETFDVDFPARQVKCSDCGGRGSTYLGWAARDQPAFTEEDMAREGPDFQQDYMRGAYDRQCPGCCGKRVVLEVLPRDKIPAGLHKHYDEWREMLREEEQDRQTYRMESGYQ